MADSTPSPVRPSPFFRYSSELLSRPEERVPIQTGASGFVFPGFGVDANTLAGQAPPPPPAPAPAPAPAVAHRSDRDEGHRQDSDGGHQQGSGHQNESDGGDQDRDREPDPPRRSEPRREEGRDSRDSDEDRAREDQRRQNDAVVLLLSAESGRGRGREIRQLEQAGYNRQEIGRAMEAADNSRRGGARHTGGIVTDDHDPQPGTETEMLLLEGEYVMPPGAVEMFGPVLEAMRAMAIERFGAGPGPGAPGEMGRASGSGLAGVGYSQPGPGPGPMMSPGVSAGAARGAGDAYAKPAFETGAGPHPLEQPEDPARTMAGLVPRRGY